MSRSLQVTRCIATFGLVVAGCDALSDETDLSPCEVPSDCVLAHDSCCGSCGPLTPDQVTSVNVRFVDAHRRRVCDANADRKTGCNTIACLPQSPRLIATCEAGRCVTVELAEHPATACSGSAECRVRATACCECNAATDKSSLIAVSDEAALGELICAPGQPCDDCAPGYPPVVTAECEANSCVVHDPRMF